MSKNLINRTKNTISATAHLPYGAYKALVQLAQDHNAEIGKTSKGFLTVTFDEVKTAENVVTRFRADYAEAHKAYMSAKASEPAPVSEQEAKPHKPANGKGNAKVLKKLDKLAGKGKSANKQAAAVIREFGIEPNGAEWDYWKSIR